MAITKMKSKQEKPFKNDSIISDTTNSESKIKGNKKQISLTIVPELLHKIDRLAEELGQSRAAVINLAIYRAVEHGLIKD
jgi:hypothetical protein